MIKHIKQIYIPCHSVNESYDQTKLIDKKVGLSCVSSNKKIKKNQRRLINK